MKKRLLLCALVVMTMLLGSCGAASQDLNDVDYDGDLDGVSVTGTVTYVYDWYCETTQDSGTQVSREYIIDAGEKYFMGMLVRAKDMDAVEDLLDACWEYEDNLDAGIDDDGDGVVEAQFQVTGTIERMPDDSEELYYEYLEDCGLTDEDMKDFLPYYLVLKKIEKK